MKRRPRLFLGWLILLLVMVTHGRALAGMVVEQIMKDKDGLTKERQPYDCASLSSHFLLPFR